MDSNFQAPADVAHSVPTVGGHGFAKFGRVLFEKYFDLVHFVVAFIACLGLLYAFFSQV